MTFQDYANWSSLGRSLQPLFEIQKITNEVFEQLTRENLALWSDDLGSAVKYMQTINSKTNSPEQLIKAQMAFFSNQGAKRLQYMQNILRICEEGMHEYQNCLQEKMDTVFSEQEPERRGRKHA